MWGSFADESFKSSTAAGTDSQTTFALGIHVTTVHA
jgi:hypothetical protein